MRFSRGKVLAACVLLLIGTAAAALWWNTRERVEYTTQKVERGRIESTVTAIGTLQPLRYVDVGAQVSGQITRLLVAPGAVVKKGDLLVEIDPSVQRATVDAGRAQLANLRAQWAEQQAQQRLATQQLARQRQMAADEATRLEDLQTAEANHAQASARIDQIRAQIDQTQATLKADEARLGYTRIYAPMAGTVVSVDAREGQTLNATYQTPDMLRIADLSGMTVWTEVSEADVRRVQPGLPVYFTTLGGAEEGDKARRWHGSVRQVLPAPQVPKAQAGGAAKPATATKAVTYTALFDVDNADGELMPQMTAQVVFITARAENALIAPLSALMLQAEAVTARVLDAAGQPQTRTLRLGARSRHQAEVLEGLGEGDRLILSETKAGGALRWLQW
ncbi:efflux RND transporter periplasmic adaptor subunit [Diaphorobacter ruginosibacter]|uniref:Efflux RND transporter periplasmic adaptor subunit n=1 Tax=Diaphorobacter ruginosibacter TaxID=1715720 RepID=A0A7G9RRX7_9BURK|nr:efflux RND transporter periplasmic adaptor subunit [Diaphorobacter ruginosibacter]QNN58352.1 efflux RND transporter periplasmic adaptor subunit [Diaphorobacter ruginosibacter]